MTQEEKQLLLKDVCARLTCGVKADGYPWIKSEWVCGVFGDEVNLQGSWVKIENVKPYLRPMSSMTKEERKVYEYFIFTEHHEWDGHSTHTEYVEIDDVERYRDWLNSHHLDYNGLIPKGLALEAPKDMYKIE